MPCALFVLLLIGSAGFLVSTIGEFPDRIATHFDWAGQANAWMTREDYLIWMLAFGVALPAVVTALVGLLPRAWPGLAFINLPNRDHWFAPDRRAESLDFLGQHACWLGCLMVLMAMGVHALVLRAHEATPPTLPVVPFVAMLIAFVFAAGVWVVVLYRRFHRRPGPDQAAATSTRQS
jgi:Domain of unknown function (DUF1648)